MGDIMAIAPAHRFGQIIGDLLEVAIAPLLKKFADDNGLYLDHQGKRPCRSGVLCTWVDDNGNKHNLDYVMESGGTLKTLGTPAAFIEVAWRRYTKHSRNKAQEIQGAIEPLAQRYRDALPFKGAVLGGDFTEGAITQLKSLGFSVIHVSYSDAVNAFATVGIDASTEQNTPDAEVQTKIDQWKKLSCADKESVAKLMIESNKSQVNAFLAGLQLAVSRKIEAIFVLPLNGHELYAASISEALVLLQGHDESSPQTQFVRYEIQIRFMNGNQITGKFNERISAIAFLEQYR